MSPLANDVAQSANDVADASDVAAMPQMAGARPAMQFDLDEDAVNLRSGAVEVEGEQTGEDPSSVGKPTPSPEGEGEAGGASPSPTGEFGGQGEVIDGAPPHPFEAAVARAHEEANLSAEERRQIAQQRREAVGQDADAAEGIFVDRCGNLYFLR